MDGHAALVGLAQDGENRGVIDQVHIEIEACRGLRDWGDPRLGFEDHGADLRLKAVHSVRTVPPAPNPSR